MRAALAALAVALAACSTPRPGAARGSLDLWPFVVRDARPVAGIATTRVAGPFYESWTRDSEADPEALTEKSEMVIVVPSWSSGGPVVGGVFPVCEKTSHPFSHFGR